MRIDTHLSSQARELIVKAGSLKFSALLFCRTKCLCKGLYLLKMGLDITASLYLN